jgi:hypothetical protein
VKRGAVVFWKNFSFDDGERPDKLLVVVGCGIDGRLLMLRTTNKPRARRPDPDGCHSDASVVRFKQYLEGFSSPTWIQFDPPIIRTPQQVIDSGAEVLFELNIDDLRAIVDCYKRSPEISDVLMTFLHETLRQ